MSPGPADRVRVTSPQTSRSGSPRRSVASEIDDQTRVGEVYIQSLIRSQLRLAAGVVAVLALTVGMLPLLFAALPGVRRAHLLGVPLPWLLLGGLVYPFLVTVAWAYVRRAERNERDFEDLLGPR